MEIDQSVELRLELPVGGPGRTCPEVVCLGRVVRTVSPSDDEPWPGSAVVIEQHDFVPPVLAFTSLSAR